jgi:hypothetical protein
VAARVVEALQEPDRFYAIREAARQFVVEHFDAERVCLPQMRQLLDLKEPPSSAARRNVWRGRSASEWPKAAPRSRKSISPPKVEWSDEGCSGRTC